MLGVDKDTVIKYRNELESRGEIRHVEKLEDTQGRKQPKTKTVINPNEKQRKYTQELYQESQSAENAKQEFEALTKGKVNPN